MARLGRGRFRWVCLLLLCPMLGSLGACAQRNEPPAGQDAAPPETPQAAADDVQPAEPRPVRFVLAGGEDLPDMSEVPTDELVALLQGDDYRLAAGAAAELPRRDPAEIAPHLPLLLDIALAPEQLDLRLRPQMRYSGIIAVCPCADGVSEAIARCGAEAVPLLEARLRPAPDEYSREEAESQQRTVKLLAEIGKPAVPALAKALTLGHPGASREALDAITKLGPDAEAAVPTLVELLMSGRSHGLGEGVENAIGAIGSAAVEPLRAELPRAAEAASLDYLHAAAELGPGGASILVQALECGEVQFRSNAASALGHMRPEEAQGAVPALLRALDADTALRPNAMSALGDLGDPRAIEPIVRTLGRDGGKHDDFALRALAELGADEYVFPALDRCFRSAERADRMRGLSVLRGQPAYIERYYEYVRACLDSDSEGLRGDAAWVLQRDPAQAKRALPRLLEMLEDPSEAARCAAAAALACSGPDAAPGIPKLIAMLGVESMSSGARSALAAIGADAVPPLLTIARDGEGNARIDALRALAETEADATEALPLLDALRQDATVSADLREAATHAYCSIRNRAERAAE